MELKQEKDNLKGSLKEIKTSISKKEFADFFKNNLYDIGKIIEIKKEDFNSEEEMMLENMGFYFSELVYENERLYKTYIYKYKEEKIISKEIMKDIIEKLNL
jgi:inorganic pyrophosphatase/exopolyphosphatase